MQACKVALNPYAGQVYRRKAMSIMRKYGKYASLIHTTSFRKQSPFTQHFDDSTFKEQILLGGKKNEKS